MPLVASMQLPITGRAGIELALAILTLENQVWIRGQRLQRRAFPALYQSGVRYRNDSVGTENWQSIPVSLRSGWGDCKTLASWRVAELRESGEDPQATWALEMHPQPNGARLWHVVVVRGNGSYEDPSRRLGMK